MYKSFHYLYTVLALSGQSWLTIGLSANSKEFVVSYVTCVMSDSIKIMQGTMRVSFI